MSNILNQILGNQLAHLKPKHWTGQDKDGNVLTVTAFKSGLDANPSAPGGWVEFDYTLDLADGRTPPSKHVLRAERSAINPHDPSATVSLDGTDVPDGVMHVSTTVKHWSLIAEIVIAGADGARWDFTGRLISL
jgi:hypothetical protein